MVDWFICLVSTPPAVTWALGQLFVPITLKLQSVRMSAILDRSCFDKAETGVFSFSMPAALKRLIPPVLRAAGIETGVFSFSMPAALSTGGISLLFIRPTRLNWAVFLGDTWFRQVKSSNTWPLVIVSIRVSLMLGLLPSIRSWPALLLSCKIGGPDTP